MREYFNTEGFNRWNKIYSDSEEVNVVQMQIRNNHQITVDKVRRPPTCFARLGPIRLGSNILTLSHRLARCSSGLTRTALRRRATPSAMLAAALVIPPCFSPSDLPTRCATTAALSS